ncbi:hypothetical protein J1614_002451 [Plenodomus biglobosus]|nr:hypothetical protein J1614_002451 [Plenodomus biglobosus]
MGEWGCASWQVECCYGRRCARRTIFRAEHPGPGLPQAVPVDEAQSFKISTIGLPRSTTSRPLPPVRTAHLCKQRKLRYIAHGLLKTGLLRRPEYPPARSSGQQ